MKPDMKNCVLFHEESEEEVEGTCGMLEDGCPYEHVPIKEYKWEVPNDLWELHLWERAGGNGSARLP
jgi:hypothetical protein